MSKGRQIRYRVEIPKETADDPIRAIVDGFTMIHKQGGISACETALETIMDVVYAEEASR